MARDEQKIESLISESQIQDSELEQKIAESKLKVFNKIIEKNSTNTASKSLFSFFLKPAFMVSITIVAVTSLILINRLNVENTDIFSDLDSSIQAIDSEITNLDGYLREFDKELAELEELI